MAASDLPPLRHIAIAELRRADIPTKKIHTDEDLVFWKTTRGYQDYGLFLRRLNESVVGYTLPWTEPPSEPAASILSMLDTLDHWIDEIPPLPTPQRFGNLAFRTWGRRLESETPSLLHTLLPSSLHPAIPFLSPYFATAFGSPVRMDYGTGHETSFALFLLCLSLLRYIEPNPVHERELVLSVFVRYLRLCWRLQDVYNLEPAGSHGVWGLDDSHFLGYIFGSAQLRDQTEYSVSAVLRPPLPLTNLYFMSIMRIHEVKHGPFHEHSSQLYSIATGVASWSKVNSGLFKMYEAEVLGKRVVVQHVFLGGLLDWSVSPDPTPSTPTPNTVPTLAPHRAALYPTSIPHTNSASALPATRVPWATTVSQASTPRSLTGSPFRTDGVHSGHWHGHGHGPIIAARMPLGPTASTALRPLDSTSGTSPRSLGNGVVSSIPPPAASKEHECARGEGGAH
ncbi:Serine/threonine-protein phosphatase 2A activator 1 [Sparassis crispa]|uniref:Serine/threonine-protein phosphatase 2A activator n=1 Tax=Sparassis crispa TaxID=139825 RepID=A0A401H6K4_9APHY|nr:Serine/threonine-protein phosphatase 2A activator 1 [Sparassis crispa]GBE90054.1 Serine/threonine-protein phosphatase 2A activator 1 [Sparassis crispa]